MVDETRRRFIKRTLAAIIVVFLIYAIYKGLLETFFEK